MSTCIRYILSIFCLLFCNALFAQQASSNEVVVINDVNYKDDTRKKIKQSPCLLDVYVRRDVEKDRPVIVLVHGGGFWEGDKQSDFYKQVANAYAISGYVAISVNYRLKEQHEPYTHSILQYCIEDVMAAVNWLKSNHKKYKIDTTLFFIAGDSAGGGIAVNTSYTRCCFVGCIDLWGGLPGEVKWEAPIYTRNIDNAIPTLIMHGTADNIIPVATSLQLKKVLDGNSIYNEMQLLEGADHYPVHLAEAIIQRMLSFTDSILSGIRRNGANP